MIPLRPYQRAALDALPASAAEARAVGANERERVSGSRAEYYNRNRANQIEKAIDWAKKNPEKAKAANKAWQERNKKELLAKAANRYRDNLDDYLSRDRLYRSTRRAERCAATRAWRKANPNKARLADANKKARRKGAPGCYTLADVERILKAQRDCCAWCRISLVEGYHIDHVHPIAKGGSNWPANLQLLCAPCNMRKHASDPIEFARREGRLL